MKPTGTVFPGDPDESPTQALKYDMHLVISLGTGTSKMEKKYNAEMAEKWGILGWIHSEGNSPLINAFISASADMVDHYMSLIFKSIRCEHNYLLIEVFNITLQLPVLYICACVFCV